MKTFKFDVIGNAPKFVQSVVDQFNGKPVNNSSIYALDDEIRFVVCDLGEAHGNLNKAGKTAWLSPRNNDGSFNVSISW